MASPLPEFGAPPVVEAVLSLQFARLPGYTTAHAGWFWKSFLASAASDLPVEWKIASEVPRLDDQFERFAPDDLWATGVGVRMLPLGESQRIQLTTANGDRMLQLQDSRVILNWRKQTESNYPRFSKLLPEFRACYKAMGDFVAVAMPSAGAIEPNQWEVIYVNHFPRGELWQSLSELSNLLPHAYIPRALAADGTDACPESLSGDWRFSLPDDHGRLYVSLRHGKTPGDGAEALILTLTSRGPVTSSSSWETGFQLGHDAIVRTFAAMTAAEAHKRWKRRV